MLNDLPPREFFFSSNQLPTTCVIEQGTSISCSWAISVELGLNTLVLLSPYIQLHFLNYVYIKQTQLPYVSLFDPYSNKKKKTQVKLPLRLNINDKKELLYFLCFLRVTEICLQQFYIITINTVFKTHVQIVSDYQIYVVLINFIQ